MLKVFKPLLLLAALAPYTHGITTPAHIDIDNQNDFFVSSVRNLLLISLKL